MAAKKKKTAKTARPGKKAAAKKKAATRKKAKAGKKTPAKKSAAVKKKAAAKKAAPKKKAAPEKKAASSTTAESPPRSPAKTPPSETQATTSPKAKAEAVEQPRPAGSVSSMDVNLGHVFALKPRVLTSFRQHHFLEAKRALVDEVFEDLAQAARAVAEEALAITRGTAKGPDFRKRG